MSTQLQRIHDALVVAGNRGACLWDFDRADSYTARNRVAELRNRGVDIVSERCTQHEHRSTVVRYRIAPKIEQRELFA